MAKTIKEILDKHYINTSVQPKENVFFSEDHSTGEVYPYRFLQDGADDYIEYVDFRAAVIPTIKFFSPKGKWFQTLIEKDFAFKDSESAVLQADKEWFGLECAAMFDQISTSLTVNIKDAGGLCIIPNWEYFAKRLADAEAKRETLTNIRREFQKVIRSCVAHNYAEVEKLNKTLDESKQIKLPTQTKTFMKNIAIAEGTIKDNGKNK